MSVDDAIDPRSKTGVLVELGANPKLAHQVIFKHRHPQDTPAFHWEIIDLWHSDVQRVLVQAFRGAGKSTIAEEAITVQACLRKFHNGIILGETYERAVERLRAIRHELETNSIIESLFGNLVGQTWTEGKIILSNGVIIQAFGRGQSLRGSKHLDFRPDRCFGDDIENDESVQTIDAIEKCKRWLMSVVIPALDPDFKIRINGTPLHPKSVISQLAEDKDWLTRIYPIEHVSPEGERQATWADRFPLSWIDDNRRSYERLGLHDSYMQEFMCQAEDPAEKPFTPDLFTTHVTVRSWEAVYACYDPARTVKSTSASTGVAIWSWVGNRLLVWDAYAGLWKPDEIIADMFRVDDTYRPVVIGVEKDGLEEFIMQPLRQEQLKRGHAIPIRELKAPKGKRDFIRGLQPFFRAREVIFAKPLPEAQVQFLSFPSGKIDIPNALAYALSMRPGQPIYDGWTVQNVVEDLPRQNSVPCYLAVNTDGACTSAALVQVIDGGLAILADGVSEGDAGSSLPALRSALGVEAGGGKLKCFAGPAHFADYDTLGLRAACRKIPVDLNRGGPVLHGREEVRDLIGRDIKGHRALRVSSQARWTLNAFAGGYCRELTRHGILTEYANPGPYKVLMEGIESFAALLKSSSIREDEPVNWQTTRDGRRYISMLGNPR